MEILLVAAFAALAGIVRAQFGPLEQRIRRSRKECDEIARRHGSGTRCAAERRAGAVGYLVGCLFFYALIRGGNMRASDND